MGFFNKLAAMPKSMGRKIMLETLTIDPFTGNILRSCELKFIFNSGSKPLLLEMVFQNRTLMPKQVIFKKDDECRNDFVIHKIFGIFNDIWQSSGFGQTVPYIVTYNIACISKDMCCYEYTPSVPLSVFAFESIKDLTENEKANLLHSFAAVMVSCYVLGIRDRSLDNVLIKEHTFMSLIDIRGLWNTAAQEKQDKNAPVSQTDDKVIINKFKSFFQSDWEKVKIICERIYLVLHKNASFLTNCLLHLYEFDTEQNKDRMFQWLMRSLAVGRRLTKTDCVVIANTILFEQSMTQSTTPNKTSGFSFGNW